MTRKSLKYIPSLDKFIPFSDFTNEDWDKLIHSQEDIDDSIYNQIRLLTKSVDNPKDVESLNILDYFTVFLSWRITCLEPSSEIDFQDWIPYLQNLLDMKTKKEVVVDIGGNDIRIVIDVPSYKDVMTSYQKSYKSGDDETDRTVSIVESLNSFSWLHSFGGSGFSSLEEKRLLYENLPISVYEEINKHILWVNDMVDLLDFSFTVGENTSKINIFNIPYVIRMIFACSYENYYTKYLFLAKKRNVDWDFYQSITPMNADQILDDVIKDEKDSKGGGDNMDELIS